MKRSPVIERAQRDLAAGRHWLARRRLASHLRDRWDPAVAEQLARVCLDMHDAAEAGRWWIATGAEGRDVDAAVDEFLRSCGRKGAHVRARLPRAVRRLDILTLPDGGRGRLGAVGIEQLDGPPGAGAAQAKEPAEKKGGCWAGVGCLLLVLGVLGLAVVGLAAIAVRLFGG